MPFGEVRRRWLALLRERPMERELSEADRVKRLAQEFGVTTSAMRVGLEQMRLVGR